MPGKLHLICMKTVGFHAKFRCNLNNISYLIENRKIIFNSYNNNFFPYFLLFSIYNNYVFLKVMFCAKRFAHLDYDMRT